MSIWLQLNKDWLEKNSLEGNRNAIEELGEEQGKNILLWQDLESKVEIEEITDKYIDLSISNDFVSINFSVNFTVDEFIAIIEIAVKKMEIFKNILQNLNK